MTRELPEQTPAQVRVSVVVPVFNPGPGFDDLMESLDRQTLAQDEFEVLLCDDGSDEPTRHRLQQVMRARSNVRVLTLAHTGWPGTPRNHGIAAARGTYVFFADQDDRLFETALEQLCDYADRHSSDVVIGKVVGVGRRIPRSIFRRDIPRAVLGKDPLLELLTPHKLFRSSFLRENDIRFPDGRVRLEDHLFVMRAYFRAQVISVLASQPCYAWVKNDGSASSSRIDPDTYFPHLETVLDLVEANTEPGPLRDKLLRHWYRGKILKRLEGSRMAGYPDDYRTRFLEVVEPLARKRFGPAVEQGLAFPLRVRSALLRAGRRDELQRLAAFEAALECWAEVTSAQWSRTGKLALTIEVRVVHDEKDALVFERREPLATTSTDDAGATAAVVWRPPAALGLDLLPSTVLDASRELRRDRVDLLLRDGVSDTERRIARRALTDSAAVTVTIDPLRVFGRHNQSTGGQLVVDVRRAGWTFETALRADEAVLGEVGPSPVAAGRRCELVLTGDGTLELRRRWPAGHVRDFAARAMRRTASFVRRVPGRDGHLIGR